MVLADVGMREDVIAKPLRVPQACAMPEHQPGMRPQHRDMVRDVPGVGWADPDVDQGNASIPGLDEVKGRHLRHAPWRDPGRAAAKTRTARDHIAGPNERIGTDLAAGTALLAQLHEGIDIELVVRE